MNDLTESALVTMPYSDGSEADIITRLRTDGDLSLSRVSIDKTAIIAHVDFS